jgi:hypothetical protein
MIPVLGIHGHPHPVFFRMDVILEELFRCHAQECDWRQFRSKDARFARDLNGLYGCGRELNTKVTSQGRTICLPCQHILHYGILG